MLDFTPATGSSAQQPVLWMSRSLEARTAWVGPGRAGARPAGPARSILCARPRRCAGHDTRTHALRARGKVLPENRAASRHRPGLNVREQPGSAPGLQPGREEEIDKPHPVKRGPPVGAPLLGSAPGHARKPKRCAPAPLFPAAAAQPSAAPCRRGVDGPCNHGHPRLHAAGLAASEVSRPAVFLHWIG